MIVAQRLNLELPRTRADLTPVLVYWRRDLVLGKRFRKRSAQGGDDEVVMLAAVVGFCQLVQNRQGLRESEAVVFGLRVGGGGGGGGVMLEDLDGDVVVRHLRALLCFGVLALDLIWFSRRGVAVKLVSGVTRWSDLRLTCLGLGSSFMS